MKFQQLPLGARFEYAGEVWTKSGPLTATGAGGAQRVIPRFAALHPLDGQAAPARAARRLDEAAVRAAFATFYAECAGLLVGETDGPGDVLAARARRARLEVARERFLAALEQAGAG